MLPISAAICLTPIRRQEIVRMSEMTPQFRSLFEISTRCLCSQGTDSARFRNLAQPKNHAQKTRHQRFRTSVLDFFNTKAHIKHSFYLQNRLLLLFLHLDTPLALLHRSPPIPPHSAQSSENPNPTVAWFNSFLTPHHIAMLTSPSTSQQVSMVLR